VSDLFETRRLRVLLPRPLLGPLDYACGQELLAGDSPLKTGDFVRVPLAGRKEIGVVWADGNHEEEGDLLPLEKLKPIQQRLSLPPLPDTLCRFIDWVADYTLTQPGAVLKMAMSVPRAVEEMPRRTLYVGGGSLPSKMTDARRAVLAVAADGRARSVQDFARRADVSASVVRGLVKAESLLPIQVAGDDDFPVPDGFRHGPALSNDQTAAALALREGVQQGAFAVYLLEGVTGSGKTEVYFEAIAEAIRATTGQVMVLLPEIALTSQWLDRFRERFGEAPVVWHSDLTLAQRRRAWMAVASGQARVVVGARSALFLPFAELSLIVVDEEHSPTYKQEEGVMYNARDMAVVRGKMSACAVVLASATPSLETLINAQSEKYHWLYLGERHGEAVLPDIEAIDMRKMKMPAGQWLSPPLVDALGAGLEKGEQSLLYLNRRGYAPLTLCRSCGHRFECASCSAWLVEHRHKHQLMCHHCGYHTTMPDKCPSCEAEDSLAACGPGVERLAEEVERLWPEARVAIMASDVMGHPERARQMIRQITDHEVDIIIGTQIVTKGYHFPALTLVGVIDADLGLGGGDPRAAERTFQQLEQVAGRAGRAEKPGRVFLQSYMPDHPVMAALIAGERDAFYEQEAESRERQGMPPFGKLVGLILSGADMAKVADAARHFVRYAPRDPRIQVLGPVPAPLARLRDRHRYRILLKAEKGINVQKVLSHWQKTAPKMKGVRLQIDVDPHSFY